MAFSLAWRQIDKGAAMKTREFFYPGFEHAGLETPLDRALTWSLCAAVLSVAGVFEGVSNVVSRITPRLEPQFDA